MSSFPWLTLCCMYLPAYLCCFVVANIFVFVAVCVFVCVHVSLSVCLSHCDDFRSSQQMMIYFALVDIIFDKYYVGMITLMQCIESSPPPPPSKENTHACIE